MRPDPHSFFDDEQRRVTHLDWQLRVDLATRVIDAVARLRLAPGAAPLLDLDTHELTIGEVRDGAGAALRWELGAPHPVFGQRLRVQLPAEAETIAIAYRTSPTAAALDFCDGAVYSQCQPIFARSLVPVPDSPSARLTASIELTAPAELTALFAASLLERRVDGAIAISRFAIEQPLPPYLLAFAVGNFTARELSPRSRVWAVPSLLDRAAAALADIERILAAAEALLGTYPWPRFDLLIAPPSFPYGGMENPQLAFLSPTLLASDGAPDSPLGLVVTHELAHAWTGNLVGCASAEHFWLNEGFTVWAERRLVEARAGRAAADLQASLGRRELIRALPAFAAQPERTHLRTHLEGIDPDDALSLVPYEKGYLLLRTLEDRVGRPRFDAFVRSYLSHFAGTAITTEQWRAFATSELGPSFDLSAWLDFPNLPEPGPEPEPAPAPESPPTAATLWPWRAFLDSLPRPFDCAALDARFSLSSTPYPELLIPWLTLAIASDYAPALSRLDAALSLGRIKHTRPLYLALAARDRERAGRLYRAHRHRYHAIARRQLERALRDLGVTTHEVNAVALPGLSRRRP